MQTTHKASSNGPTTTSMANVPTCYSDLYPMKFQCIYETGDLCNSIVDLTLNIPQIVRKLANQIFVRMYCIF
jgi:hypothetical protein